MPKSQIEHLLTFCLFNFKIRVLFKKKVKKKKKEKLQGYG